MMNGSMGFIVWEIIWVRFYFIFLDAYDDVEDDIAHNQYNPLKKISVKLILRIVAN